MGNQQLFRLFLRSGRADAQPLVADVAHRRAAVDEDTADPVGESARGQLPDGLRQVDFHRRDHALWQRDDLRLLIIPVEDDRLAVARARHQVDRAADGAPFLDIKAQLHAAAQIRHILIHGLADLSGKPVHQVSRHAGPLLQLDHVVKLHLIENHADSSFCIGGRPPRRPCLKVAFSPAARRSCPPFGFSIRMRFFPSGWCVCPSFLHGS